MYCLHVFLRAMLRTLAYLCTSLRCPTLKIVKSASPVSNEVNDSVLPLTHAVPIGVARDLFDKRHLMTDLSRPGAVCVLPFLGRR